MAMDNAKMNKAGTIRKVLSYMKRYIPLLVISLALSVVTVALTLYFPILTGRAIDLIVGKEMCIRDRDIRTWSILTDSSRSCME